MTAAPTGEAPESGLTLAVTSSTGVMGLAIGRVADPAIEDAPAVYDLLEVVVATDRRHAEEIGPAMKRLLADAGVGFADLERLVIDVGPGRFTGLRVGLATVRALAFALDLPVVGLTSLEILSAGAVSAGEQQLGGAVTAVIDARRSEVFQQVFVDGRPVCPAEVGNPALLSAGARGLVVGDGVDRYLDHYRAKPGLTVLSDRHPRAAAMLALSGGRPGRPGTAVEPLYLREPDANPNIKTRLGAAGDTIDGVARTEATKIEVAQP